MRIEASPARAVALAIACAAFTLASSALAQSGAPARQVAVAEATLPADLAFAREPLAEHVRIRLREGAVDGAPGARVGEPARGEGSETCARVSSSASDGAARVVLADLRRTERGIDVALRVYEPSGCKLASAARISGSGPELGPALDEAVARILPALGGSAALLAPSMLGLADLEAESRALDQIRARELARAYRILDGDSSTLATALRGRIDALAAERDTPPAERVRLAIARGSLASGDVTARQIMMAAARSFDGEPADARVLLAAGELQLSRGEAGEARRYLQLAAELAPANPDVHLGHGRALALLQDSAAKISFERAAALEPGSSTAVEALAELETASPAKQAAVLLRAGEIASRAFDERRARADFARALEIDPTVAPAAKEGIALLYARLADPERARASWREAIDAGGVTPARVLGVAQASRLLGDTKSAEQAFLQAAELDPGSAGAALGLGQLYTDAGRFDEARPWLTRAVSLEPANPDAKRELAIALGRSGDAKAALELLQAAELAGGAAPELHGARAMILAASGDVSGARASLRTAVELDPVDPALRLDLATAHERGGDLEAAALERETAALLTPAGAQIAQSEAAPTDAPTRSAASEAGPVDETLDALLRSFAAVQAETGRVALIGVREPIDFVRAPLDCLRAPLVCLTPRVPDRARLDDALARVIGTRYALVPPRELERAFENSANDALIGALLRFESKSSLDAEAVEQANVMLGSDAVFLARVERAPAAGRDGAATCAGGTPWRLELRQLAGRSPRTTRILGNALCLDARGEYSRWNPITLSLLGVVALALLFQLLRGWGSVAVLVELPPQTRALFSISLSRRPRKPKAAKSQKNREKAKSLIEDGLRRLNRYERPLRQGSATVFTWIPARWRPFYVTVRGPLQNTVTGELIGDFLEEHTVRVRRGRSVTAKFDLRPKEAVVEIVVSRGENSEGPIALALRGVPTSLRYANDGGVFLYLQPGPHVLLVAIGDRLLERLFEVRTFDPMRLTIDLARERDWLISGSQPAVQAYLEGDAARAVVELERVGETKAASKIRAKLLRAQSEPAAAVVEPPTPAAAAALFEQAGEFADAAEAHRAAGDLAAAARAYERSGDLASAIECASQTSDAEYLLALYEKNGDSFEAGELARREGQAERALRSFAQVDRIDPNYRKSCQRLVELHAGRNELRPALEKLEELVGLEGGDEAPLPLRSTQARLLEALGRGEDALRVWESIAARDPRFHGASERVAALRGMHRSTPAAAARAPAAAAEEVESRYELIEELGRGAMGVVYKARDKRLGRIVALKRLTDSLRGHPTAIAYFEREARSAAALTHPNIVVVYDAGQENGQYFITMEHLEGTTLEQIVSKRGPTSAAVVASLGLQICAGLHYAHANKIIHRDIKPANLFYTRERVVKIMDFGLAKMIEEVRKGATMIGGTPYYMAPEQALGQNVDHRADLYALGVTFFNLLTNSHPFESGDVTFHHSHTAAPDVRERVPGIPAEMAALVAKLMAKRPEDRFQSAAEVAQALRG
ncbi:MAG: tetratricopeptide repeat protein [Deltaproteobacteria bacterium]|nr:tetratricopeptide repeat protein [Deltaproteobacteria bacterium]